MKNLAIWFLILFSFSLKGKTIQNADYEPNVIIAKWKGNKKAALNLQFDDSTPGQATLGIHALNKRNIIGTWYVNPGREEFNKYLHFWEDTATAGGQELANHTMTHSGASNHKQIEYEVGEASRIIWHIRKQKEFESLIAFCTGGGTSWDQEDLKQVLTQFHNIDRISNAGVKVDAKTILPGSSSDDMYETIPKIIQDGIWGRLHFHGITNIKGNPPKDFGNGAVMIDEFEKFLDKLLQDTDKLWIAGYIQVYKYIKERETAEISMIQIDDRIFQINLKSNMDGKYYDEPLTVLANVPISWNNCIISINDKKKSIKIVNGIAMFDLLPNPGDVLLIKK